MATRAKAVARGLEYCHNLKILDASCNEIADDGAIAIAEAMKMIAHGSECLIWNDGLILREEGLFCRAAVIFQVAHLIAAVLK